MEYRTMVLYTDNYLHDPYYYLAPAKATDADLARYAEQLNRHGYTVWFSAALLIKEERK